MEQLSEVAIQAWIDQGICPECKAKYPERTVQYADARALGTHRKFKHGVTGKTTEILNRPKMFEKTAEGMWICPECGQNDFAMPLLVGRHRKKAHGIAGAAVKKKKNIFKKPAALARVESTREPAKIESPEMLLDGPAIYLYGRLEAQIEAYAKDNGLLAKKLVHMVGELLAGA